MALAAPQPPRWVIDEGPLDLTAQCLLLPLPAPAAWARAHIAVTEETARQLVHSPRRQALADALQQAQALSVLRFGIGDPAEHILRTHLRRPGDAATANLGEHQAIAWMLAHPSEDAVLVLSDKRAIPRALAELGRHRVAHTFEWWEHLHTLQLITPQDLNALCMAQRRRDQSIPLPWRQRKS